MNMTKKLSIRFFSNKTQNRIKMAIDLRIFVNTSELTLPKLLFLSKNFLKTTIRSPKIDNKKNALRLMMSVAWLKYSLR
ncbi:MAG: hypothetical protein Fur0010_13060 [Bdellovibrio sp.]